MLLCVFYHDIYSHTYVYFEGCWLSVSSCTNDSSIVGVYRDTWGESYKSTSNNETACLQRAVDIWKYCGSGKDEQVVAVYGPTGLFIIQLWFIWVC